MWKCSKCGREFENQDQTHACNAPVTIIDEYIAEQPEAVQPILNQIRDTLRSVLPDTQERISYRMPTFWKMHNIIHFAAQKSHVGLYPGPDAIAHFANRLKEYKTSKGAVQFPYEKPIPLDLIAEIAQWCADTGNHA